MKETCLWLLLDYEDAVKVQVLPGDIHMKSYSLSFLHPNTIETQDHGETGEHWT